MPEDEPLAVSPVNPVPASKRLVMINAASSVFTHVLNITVLVWLQQYLLARISISEYALYPVVTAPLVFIPLMATVLTGGIGRYVVEAYARKDSRRITEIVSTLSPFLAGAGVLVLILGGLFARHIDRILLIPQAHAADARLMLTILVMGATIQLLLAPFEIGLYVHQRFVLINAIRLGTHVLRLGLLLGLLLGAGPRVLWVVVATVTADTIGLIVTVVISRRCVPALSLRRGSIRWGAAPELLSFGSWNFVRQLAGTARRGAVPIILNRLATPLDVSCFYLGFLAFQQIQNLLETATQPIEPALVALHTHNNRSALGRAYLLGGRYSLWLATFLAVPLIVFRDELFTLYAGPDKLQAATVMMILLLALPFQAGNIMCAKLARAMAQVKPLARQVLINQGLNLILTLAFVWWLRLGAVGAALGTLIVASVMQPAVMWRMGRRFAGVSFPLWRRETLIPGLLPGATGAVVWFSMKLWASPTTWTDLAICETAGALCFLGVLVAFCLPRQERESLKKGGLRFAAAFASRMGRPRP